MYISATKMKKMSQIYVYLQLHACQRPRSKHFYMGKVAVRLMVKKRLNFKLTSYSTIKSTGFDGLEFFGNDMDGPLL